MATSADARHYADAPSPFTIDVYGEATVRQIIAGESDTPPFAIPGWFYPTEERTEAYFVIKVEQR